MRSVGSTARPRPGATTPPPGIPNLVKRGWREPTKIDQLWVADFSYVWTLAGFCYVAFVVDVYSRRILGWRVTTTKHTSMVTDALRQALQLRRRQAGRAGPLVSGRSDSPL